MSGIYREQADNILMTLPTTDSGNYRHDDLVPVIAAALQAQGERVEALESAVEVIQSSRDILLNTFCRWSVEYQKGKMALREVEKLEQERNLFRASMHERLKDYGAACDRENALKQQLATCKARIRELEAQVDERTSSKQEGW